MDMLLAMIATLGALPAFATPIPLGPSPGGGISFDVGSTAGAVRGGLDVFTAQIDIEARTGVFVGQSSTVSTGLGPRDQRLLYFALDVVAFPEIRFAASRIEGSVAELASGTGSGVLRFIGALTIRDATLPLAVPATFTYEGDKLQIQGDISFEWASFGVPDPSVLIARVDPTLHVVFNLVGSRE